MSPRRLAMITYREALALLTRFDTKIEAGEHPETIVRAMPDEEVLLTLAAVKQTAWMMVHLDEIFASVLESRGANLASMEQRSVNVPKPRQPDTADPR